MSAPFVLQTAAGPRWTVHPPHDPYGDGRVLKFATELHDDGMTASTVACIDGVAVYPHSTSLPAFVESLAADWRGWNGIRTWESMGGELAIGAQHDGGGHVSLGVTFRAPGHHPDDTAWSARAVFVLEAGEELTRLAADLTHLLRV